MVYSEPTLRFPQSLKKANKLLVSTCLDAIIGTGRRPISSSLIFPRERVGSYVHLRVNPSNYRQFKVQLRVRTYVYIIVLFVYHVVTYSTCTYRYTVRAYVRTCMYMHAQLIGMMHRTCTATAKTFIRSMTSWELSGRRLNLLRSCGFARRYSHSARSHLFSASPTLPLCFLFCVFVCERCLFEFRYCFATDRRDLLCDCCIQVLRASDLHLFCRRAVN